MQPIVFIPGFMCDARLFAPQIAHFSSSHCVHLGNITQRSTMAELAAELLQQAPPGFALCGLSMGGIVAMEILRQAPERVSALALLDTNALAEDRSIQARRDEQISQVRAGKLLEVMRDELKPNYLYQRSAAILDTCLDMAMQLGPEVFQRQARALQQRIDQRPTLQKWRGPALIMHGEHDRLCPAARHQLMHQLMPQAHYAMIPAAGHLITLEQPEATNKQLADWLNQGNSD